MKDVIVRPDLPAAAWLIVEPPTGERFLLAGSEGSAFELLRYLEE